MKFLSIFVLFVLYIGQVQASRHCNMPEVWQSLCPILERRIEQTQSKMKLQEPIVLDLESFLNKRHYPFEALHALQKVMPKTTIELLMAVRFRGVSVEHAEGIARYIKTIVNACQFKNKSAFDENTSHIIGREWQEIDYSGEGMTWQKQKSKYASFGITNFKTEENVKKFFSVESRLPYFKKIYQPENCKIFNHSKVGSFSMISKSTREQVKTIASEYEKEYFDLHPEEGDFWGKKDIDHGKFSSHNLEKLRAWKKRESEYLSTLNALNVNDLKGSSEYQTFKLLKENLENRQGAYICNEDLWRVDPTLRGFHNIMCMLADRQPVGTAENRALALKRWRTFDTVVRDEIENLKVGIREGYTAPKVSVEAVLKQLKIVLNQPIEKSPFYSMAKRDDEDHFKKQISRIIEDVIHPALHRYGQFLEIEYMQKAREEVGISSLPNGHLCYASKVKELTTLNASAEEIHHFGLEYMKVIYKQVGDIGEREFGVRDIVEVFRLAKEKTKNSFHTEQDILKYNHAALQRAHDILPDWFSTTPKSVGIIKPYPLHRAQTGAPGEYSPPNEEGTRPGIFYINTFQPESKSRMDQEAILFHELIPGHHYQVALAYEDKSHHPIEKYLWNAGFGEGWALYVERLSDEMGLYSDNMSRLGMLSNEALRTARLVVDPGLHVMGWSREKAIDYLKKHTVMEEHMIESEVDRYIMLPAQATAYMLGKREIESLRDKAKEKLGSDFDIRAYHHEVLKNGAVTLPMLRAQIDQWIGS